MRQVPDMPGFPGIPSHLQGDLTRTALNRPELNALQRTEIYLRWLVAERKQPTNTYLGLGGGPIDSSYVLANLSAALSGTEARALRWLQESNRVQDPYLREALAVALGEAGDIQQHQRIAKIARESDDGYLRLDAASALYVMGAPELMEVLDYQAARDPFIVIIQDKPYYVVRNAARKMLHTLSKEGIRSAQSSIMPQGWRRELFAKAMAGYDSFEKVHATDLQRLLRVCNGDIGPIGP